MRTIFPIVVNMVFGLCLVGIIFIPVELNLPTKMLLIFYIVSIIILVLIFGLTYTIIDARNILLNIDKNINKMQHRTHDLTQNISEIKPYDIGKSQNNIPNDSKGDNTVDTENRLICPYCGADYSEYPYAKACYNCHKFFETDEK